MPRVDGKQRLRLDDIDEARAVVLVEGVSDQRAVEALAERRGRNLDAEGISVVPIGGAQAIGKFLKLYRPSGARRQAGGSLRRRRGGRVPARSRAGRPRLPAHSRRHGTAGLLRVRRRSRGRADPRSRCRGRGRGRRRAGRAWLLPHPPEAACVAGPGHRGAASALHGQRRQPEDPLRALARRGARSHARCLGRSTWCSLMSEPAPERGRRPADRRDPEPGHPQPRDHPLLLASRRGLRGGERRRRELVHVRDVGLATSGADDSRRGPARAPRPQARGRSLAAAPDRDAVAAAAAQRASSSARPGSAA